MNRMLLPILQLYDLFGQIEEIKSVDDHYDTYGAKYDIQDNRLVCKCLGEEIYHWDIVREDNDVRIIKND